MREVWWTKDDLELFAQQALKAQVVRANLNVSLYGVRAEVKETRLLLHLGKRLMTISVFTDNSTVSVSECASIKFSGAFKPPEIRCLMAVFNEIACYPPMQSEEGG